MDDQPRVDARFEDVEIQLDGVVLHGDLATPPGAEALVLFAHGSGSSRFSSRNRAVASALQQAGLATLLIDLLTSEEERRDAVTGMYRFDIRLLAERVAFIGDWAARAPRSWPGGIGYFGASTGAAAALLAAAQHPEHVGAVVSRGGRPDLAGAALREVRAPTLLIVGGADAGVIDLNRDAFAQLRCPATLEVIPGATHLFEEPGALERVARLARRWFLHHLTREAQDPLAAASFHPPLARLP